MFCSDRAFRHKKQLKLRSRLTPGVCREIIPADRWPVLYYRVKTVLDGLHVYIFFVLYISAAGIVKRLGHTLPYIILIEINKYTRNVVITNTVKPQMKINQ